MDGIIRVEKIVAEFDVWLDASLFPLPRMRVKVIERSRDDYLAVANLRRRDAISHEPEGISGLGNTIDESLSDLLTGFVAEARKNVPVGGFDESDFEWSAPEDF